MQFPGQRKDRNFKRPRSSIQVPRRVPTIMWEGCLGARERCEGASQGDGGEGIRSRLSFEGTCPSYGLERPLEITDS
jgi:hypothetical protein